MLILQILLPTCIVFIFRSLRDHGITNKDNAYKHQPTYMSSYLMLDGGFFLVDR